MEIKNFRTVSFEKTPWIKAFFACETPQVTFYDLQLCESKDGELYIKEPTNSKPYQNSEGKSIYPRYYYLQDVLKAKITPLAIALLPVEPVQQPQNNGGGGMNQGGFEEPAFNPSDEIPF